MNTIRSFAAALALLIAPLAGISVPALADTTTAVRFQPGGDSASYSGRIRGDETARFVIDARRGQNMKVILSAGNKASYFNVLPPGSREAIFIGSTSGNRYSGTLPQSGRYTIEVYLMRSAARRNETSKFTINIAIPASAPLQDQADGDAGGPDSWVVTGVANGDRLNVRTSPSANAAVVGRLRNGAVVRNLGCRTIGSSRWCRVSARGEGGVHGWTNGRFLSEGGDHATYNEPHMVDDGEVHDVKCKKNSRDCIRKAEKVCGGEFRTLHSESHAGGLLKDTLPGPVIWYYLEYECGYSDGRLPKFAFRGPHYDREYDADDAFTGHDSYGKAANEAVMRDACKSAAALAFNQRAKHVLVLPVERNGDGYAVYGQYPDEGPDITTFTCKFNQSGQFKHVHRN
jgi:Bacterial SH3 domain